MINFIKHSIVSLVVLVLLLHQFVPHSHNQALTEEEHTEIHEQSNHCFVDYLSFVFHEYTNTHDLENIKPHSEDVVPFSPFFLIYFVRLVSDHLSDAINQLSGNFKLLNNEILPSSPAPACLDMRPPPTFMCC